MFVFPRSRQGLTLLELAVVVMIIGIMAVMLWPAVGWYQKRAMRINCTSNLQGLYVATNAYLGQTNYTWPQVPYDASKPEENMKAWHDLLKPYGLGWTNWVCPAVQKKLGNPDVTKEKLHRSDYIAMRFDSKPGTPRRWANQPWFAERQAVHKGGNLIIMSTGATMTLSDALKISKQPQSFGQ